MKLTKSQKMVFWAMNVKMLKVLKEKDDLEKQGNTAGALLKEKLYQHILEEAIAFVDTTEKESIFIN